MPPLPTGEINPLRSRARWERASFPLGRVGPEDKFHRPAILKHVLICDPVLGPFLPVYLQALHVVVRVAISITPSAGDDQLLPLTEVDGQGLVPRRVDQECGLPGDWVQTDHVPEKPSLHGPGVAVPRKPGDARVVPRLCNLAGLIHRAIMSVDVIVQVRDVECSVPISTHQRNANTNVGTYGSLVASNIMPVGLPGFAPTVNIVSSLDRKVLGPPIKSTSFPISWISAHE